jgi:hypothetical protein
MSARLTQQQIQDMIDAAVLAATQQQQVAIAAVVDAANQQHLGAQQNLQQQLQQANQQLVNLQAVQIPAQQEQPQAAVPPAAAIVPPPPVVFALSPGTAVGRGVNNLIDYNTKVGAEVAKVATAKLAVEHDLNREHLNRFLEALRSRAIQQGWYDGLFRVVQNGMELNIIESYGTLTRDATKAAARAHIFDESRRTQYTINLFDCLEETLTKDEKDTLYAESVNYTLRRGDVQVPVAPGTDANQNRRDGLTFL